MAIEIDWNATLLDQLRGHWTDLLRPRLEGLTDEELRWEPVEGMWGVRHPGESTAPVQAGSGEWLADWAFPEPTPPPITTIAWRLGHLTIGVFGMRNHHHFGGPLVDYADTEWWGTADAALAALDAGYERWVAGVASLGTAGLAEPIRPTEGPWAEAPYAMLVTHIHREVIHHGAEIALLRDLYRDRATLHR
jgi:hypothetical protein